MLAGLSPRRYRLGLKPVGEQVEHEVSRRFVARTETALAELLAADLSEVELVALMVDGMHFAGHLCAVALGIDIEGSKHPLAVAVAVAEGSTENTPWSAACWSACASAAWDTSRPLLAVLDGSKALAAAVTEVFERPLPPSPSRCREPFEPRFHLCAQQSLQRPPPRLTTGRGIAE